MNWIEMAYREYFPLFLSIGMRNYGLNRDMAQEKIQETFVLVLKKKDSIENYSESGVRGYAIRTYRNLCINHVRRKSPFVIPNDRALDNNKKNNSHVENYSDENIHPLFEILLIEEKRLQEKAINMLPLKYQKVVQLSLTGYKPRDIAKKLEIKMTTLNNYKHRGFQKYEKIIHKIDPLRKNEWKKN